MADDLELMMRSIEGEAPSPDFVATLRQRIVAEAEAITSAIDDGDQPVVEIDLRPQAEERTMTTTRWMLAGLAAAAIALIVGFMALSGDGDDGGLELDTVDTPTTLPADSDGSEIDAAALAAIGERLVTALDERDTDTVAQLIADDAVSINMFDAFTKSDVLALLPWMDATGMRLESPQCEGTEPDQVECTPIQSMRWATAAGGGRLPGTMFLKVEDGRVTALRYSRPAFGFQHDRFSEFIRDLDPTAPEKMWYTAGDGQSYAIRNEESYGLFEKYTEEFWQARRG